MAELGFTGNHRIVYQAVAFATDLDVTGKFYAPDGMGSEVFNLTELGDGLYYLDYYFTKLGCYALIIYEAGIPKKSNTYRVISPAGIIKHIKRD